MPITFVGASASVTSGTNPFAQLPSGVIKDDLLVIVSVGGVTPATPAGWNLLNSQGAGQFITVFWRFAAADDGSNTQLTMAGTTNRAVMLAYRGAGAIELRPAFTTGTGTTATPNTLTTTYANDRVISIYGTAVGTATLTANASTTARANGAPTASILGLLVADETQVSAGVSTARGATISASLAWSAFTLAIVETRDLYWTGGTGTWDATSTTRWSNTSGGAGSISLAPTLMDNVYVDANSGSPTITLSGVPVARSLTTTGATCTFTSTGTPTINGNWTLSATTTWSASGTISFVGSSTVTTNGVSIGAPINFTPGGLTPSSLIMTLGGNLTTTSNFTLTAGNLNLNTFSLTALTFVSNTTNTRNINFGTDSVINLTGNAATVWNNATVTGFGTTGTPTVNFTYAGATGTRTIVHATTGGTIRTSRINFNITAGTDIIAITTASWAQNLNFTGFSGTCAPPAGLTLSGSLTLAAAMTWTTGTGTITFDSAPTNNTITTAGKTLNNVTFARIGSNHSLVDNLTLAGTFTQTAGSFNANNRNISATTYTFGDNALLTMGSGTWTATSTGAVWTMSSAAVINAGTSTIALSNTTSTALTFAGGGQPYNTLSLTGVAGTGALTITGGNRFNTLSSARTGNYTITFPISVFTTIGTWSVSGTNTTTNIVTLNSSTAGTVANLRVTSGTVNPGIAIIQDINAIGGATFTATTARNNGNNFGWSFAEGRYWVGGSGTWDATATARWAFTSGGAGGAFAPTVNDDVFVDANSGSPTITLGNNPVCRSLNTTGATCTMAGTVSALTVNGNLTLSATTTWSATTQLVVGNENCTITSNGITIASPIVINSTNIVTLSGNLTTSNLFSFSNGTLNLGTNVLTVARYDGGGTTWKLVSFGAGSSINVTGNAATVWNDSGPTYFTGTPTVNFTYAAGTGTRTVSGFTNFDLNFTAGTDTVIFAASAGCRSLNFTGFSGTFTPPTGANNMQIYGSLTLVAAMTWTTGTGTLNFFGTTDLILNNTITTAGKTLFNVTFSGITQSWALQDTLTCNILTLTNGFFNANNQNISAVSYALNGGRVTMGSGTWTASGTGTVWTNSTVASLFDAGTSTIALSNTSATALTFAGNSYVYNNLSLTGVAGTGTLTITGSNTFNTVSSARTGIYTITLAINTTTTVSAWTIDGTSATNAVTLNSSTAATRATLSDAAGTINVNFLRIQDIAATGGATFNAGGSADLGNNTGWIFNNNRYWVGGTAAWDATPGTKWSLTSGGTGGVAVPGINDNVFFDANSGAGTVTNSVTNANANNLDTTGFAGTIQGTQPITIYGNFTIGTATNWNLSGVISHQISSSKINTVQTNGKTIRPYTISGVAGTGVIRLLGPVDSISDFNMIVGTLDLNGFDFTCLNFNTNQTGIRGIRFGSNWVNITNVSAGVTTTVLDAATLTNFSWTGTGGFKLTGAPSSGTRQINLGNTAGGTEITAPNLWISNGSAGSTVNITNGFVGNMDFTGFSGTWNQNAITFYGNFTLNTGMVVSTAVGNTTTFATSGVAPFTASSRQTIVTAGKTLRNVTFSSTGLKFIQDAMTVTDVFSHTGGTLEVNNVNITSGTYSITGTQLRMGTGNWNVSGTGTAWTSGSGVILDPGTSNIRFTDATATAITFAGGGLTYNNLTLVSGTGTFTVTGNNTFNTFSSSRTLAYSINFTTGSINNVRTWSVSGSAGNVVTVASTAASFATLRSISGIQSGINFISWQWMALTNSTSSPTTNGTIPYYWYVGANSTRDVNSGGLLLTGDTSYTYYQLSTGTSWAVPSNWGSTTNNIYLLGGGGGGGGSIVPTAGGNKVSGGGGGGGGFNTLSNVTLTPGGAVAYAIGAAGSGGNGGTTTSTGTAGGTTTFNSTGPAGGGGGASTTTTTSTAGTAGTGAVNNGGAGGAGTGSANLSRVGAGGGGSGGLDGAGVAGGAGLAQSTPVGIGGAGNNNLATSLFGAIDYGRGGNGGGNGPVASQGSVGTGFGAGGGGAGTTLGAATTGAGANGTTGAILVRYQPSARTVYWVGGSGTWNTSSTANWSDSSGGPSGAAVPNSGDTVVVNASSGSPTITISGTVACGALNTTGATCTISSGSSTLNLFGNLTLSATTTWTDSAGIVNILASSTLNTNNVSVGTQVIINVSTADIAKGRPTVTLASNFTATNFLTLTSGTLDLSTFVFTAFGLSSTNTNLRSINFGSGSSFNITGGGGQTVWNMATATAFSTTGTPTINLNFGAGTGGVIVHGTTGGNEYTARINLNITGGNSATANITTGSFIQDLNFTGFTGTFAPPTALTLFGSLTASSGMTWTTGVGTITFASTSATTRTINGAGRTLANITFNGAGGLFSLAGNLISNATLTMTNGTLNANTFDVTASTYTLTSGQIVMSSGTWNTGTTWTRTGTVITPGTSTIAFNNTTATPISFAGGGAVYNNLSLTGVAGTGLLTITGANTFNTVSSSRTGNYTVTLPGSTVTTVTAWTIAGSNASTNVVTLNSTTPGTQATLRQLSGTVNPNFASIQDIAATGGATFTATAARNISNNTGWTFSPGRYWVGGNGTWTSASTTNWSNTSGGTAGAFAPSAGEDAIIDANSGSPTITLSGAIAAKTLITTGATCTLTSTGTLSLAGGMTLSATTTWSASGLLTFNGTGSVTTNGVAIAVAITVSSGTVSIADTWSNTGALTVSGGTLLLNANFTTTNTLTHNGGTLTLNNRTLTALTYTAPSTSTTTNFGTSGALNLTGNAVTVWSVPINGNWNQSGRSSVNLTYAGATGTRSINHGGSSGNRANAMNINVTAGTDSVSFQGFVRNVNFTGFAGTLSGMSVTLGGSLTLVAAMTVSASTIGLSLNADLAGGLGPFFITSAGKTINSIGYGNTDSVETVFALGSDCVINTSFNLNRGNFVTNNFNLTAATYSSSISDTRTLFLTSSTFTLTGTGIVWDTGTGGSGMLNPGTSTIVFSSATAGSASMTTAGLNFHNIQIRNGQSVTLSTSSTSTATNITAPSTTNASTVLSLSGTWSVRNFTVDGSSAANFVTISGGTLQKTSGTINLTNARLSSITAGAGATFNAFPCQRGGSVSGWRFNPNRYLVGPGTTSYDLFNFQSLTCWATTSGGVRGNTQPPGSNDIVLIDPGSNYVIMRWDANTAIGSLLVSDTVDPNLVNLRQNGAFNFDLTGSCIIPDNNILNQTVSGFTYRFFGTLAGNMVALPGRQANNVTFDGVVPVSYSLLDNFGTTASGSTRFNTITMSTGIVNTNNFTVACQTLTATAGTTTLSLGASNVFVNVALTYTGASSTLIPGISKLTIDQTGTGTITFSSNKIWYDVEIGSPTATGAVTFNTSPTIYNKLTSLRTGAYTIFITFGTTLTVGQFDIRGTAGNLVTVANTSSANNSSLNAISTYRDGSTKYFDEIQQRNIDYVTWNWIEATPAVNTSGTTPYYWYVGENSTKNVSTIGIVFATGDWLYYQLSFTSAFGWVVPSNWVNTNNAVYLLGAGGGGGGSHSASSGGNKAVGYGGGGGGFTAVTNISLTPGDQIPYQVGTGGAGGVAGGVSYPTAAAGNGGATIFNTTATAGGGTGANTGTPLPSVGVGGTGSTFNGGNGGSGVFGVNATYGGGGGGGSGGLNGAGVAGGNGINTATAGTGGAGNNNVNDFIVGSNIRYGDGGAGGSASAGVAGLGFGGGGGGAGSQISTTTTFAGGAGSQGAILIGYRVVAAAGGTGNMFLMFVP
jgi:hypothetical protein